MPVSDLYDKHRSQMDSGVQLCFHLSVKKEFGGRHTDSDEVTAPDTHL